MYQKVYSRSDERWVRVLRMQTDQGPLIVKIVRKVRIFEGRYAFVF
jgi:hypothetical protein